jgi:nucleoside-diphosphate-sugar epimerase
MRIVITGATGNIGSALVRRLLDEGGHELVGLARRPPAPARPPFDAVEWHAGDLSEDAVLPALRAAFRDADAVVHLAWGFQPSHDQGYLEALGVGGTQRVLQVLASEGVPHLVHMSSVGAYSAKRDDVPVDEGWPTGGVPSSPYSRHKAAAERLLGAHEAAEPSTTITRMRPGIVGQASAGSALLRYGMPALVPAVAIGLVPVLPLDQRLRVPVVHSRDVADAVARALEQRAAGAFNLATDPPVTAELIAAALGARSVHVPAAALRVAASAAWHARLQQVDPGWLDLGYSVPLLDTTRARTVLGWSPTVDGAAVLAETLDGMRRAASDHTPALRPRSVQEQVGRLVRRGPVSMRREP